MTIVATSSAGLAAWWLTGRLRALLGQGPVWLRWKPHVCCAVALGLAAGLAAQTWFEAIIFGVIAAPLSLLFVIDLAQKRLPDKLTLPLYPVTLMLLSVAASFGGNWGDLRRAALGSGILLMTYFAMALLFPEGLGLGDVKLAGVLGLVLGWFGWPHVLIGTLAAFILNAMVALSLLATRHIRLNSEIPFGPSMIVGAVIGATWGSIILPP